jgi:hypothetical protein
MTKCLVAELWRVPKVAEVFMKIKCWQGVWVMLLVLPLIFFFLLAGCAHFDRIMVTKFEPIRTENGVQYFKYTSFADAVYPIDSDDAERTRIAWLETWLKDNGLNQKDYTLVSRVPILRNKGLLGSVYDIYYEVKVPK